MKRKDIFKIIKENIKLGDNIINLPEGNYSKIKKFIIRKFFTFKKVKNYPTIVFPENCIFGDRTVFEGNFVFGRNYVFGRGTIFETKVPKKSDIGSVVFGESTEIGELSEFHHGLCYIGKKSKIASNVSFFEIDELFFGSGSNLKDGILIENSTFVFGPECNIGKNFNSYSTEDYFGKERFSVIQEDCSFGEGSIFTDRIDIHSNCKFGERSLFGEEYNFGLNIDIGKNCYFHSLKNCNLEGALRIPERLILEES